MAIPRQLHACASVLAEVVSVERQPFAVPAVDMMTGAEQDSCPRPRQGSSVCFPACRFVLQESKTKTRQHIVLPCLPLCTKTKFIKQYQAIAQTTDCDSQ